MMFRVLICLLIGAITVYKYIDKVNEFTELQLSIPHLAKEVKEIKEKNLELKYEIEQFESPLHLMELARKPEYGYLKHPTIDEVVVLKKSDEP